MHPPSTKSRNKSSNKLPFTVESMKQYEPFQQLEAKVKAKICELLTSGEVSPKGNVKRPPNSFILYRRDRLSELNNYMESSPGSISKLKPSMVKSEWNESDVEKAEYSRLARHKQQEHNAKFPGYKYRPIPERKWRAINENGRKKWFFESLSLVSTNILGANSGTQPYDMDIDEWIRDPANHKYVNSQILDEVLSNAKSTTRIPPGSRSCSAIQTIANYSSKNVTQPYNNADVNNHNIPYEYVNATVPLLPGDIACPQSLPLAQSPSPRSTTISSFIGSPLLYSEASFTPFTEEAHELSQDDPSSSRSISASFYKPNTTQNEVGFITTGGGV
ncbi:hypothetical protein OPQ81_010484 [Rhizoctonia solani]|nr:hypothetical protein OPQ81_010484 [Rhizoctonia solani]